MRAPAIVICLIAAALLAAPAALAQEGQPEAAVAQGATSATAAAPPPKPKSLDELLEMVAEGFETERKENTQRVERFQNNKDQQEALLNEALAVLAADEAESEALELRYNGNEPLIGTAQERLAERLGELGELFGVVRQVATDLSAQTWDSMTSSQGGSQRELLDRLGRSTELPSTEDLEALWVELQREITESDFFDHLIPFAELLHA